MELKLSNKLYIASSRPIGERCKEYIRKHTNLELVEDPEKCDVFISVLYDKLLKKDYIDSRPCFNFHPGVLPEYRGAGAYSWVLINKEKETGITLHKIDYNIDSGPIIEISKTLIYENDTAETLYERCMDLIFDLFKKRIYDLMSNNYETTENSGGNIYFRKDLEQGKDITNIVKAFTFNGKESCYYYNKKGEKKYIYYGE